MLPRLHGCTRDRYGASSPFGQLPNTLQSLGINWTGDLFFQVAIYPNRGWTDPDRVFIILASTANETVALGFRSCAFALRPLF